MSTWTQAKGDSSLVYQRHSLWSPLCTIITCFHLSIEWYVRMTDSTHCWSFYIDKVRTIVNYERVCVMGTLTLANLGVVFNVCVHWQPLCRCHLLTNLSRPSSGRGSKRMESIHGVTIVATFWHIEESTLPCAYSVFGKHFLQTVSSVSDLLWCFPNISETFRKQMRII